MWQCVAAEQWVRMTEQHDARRVLVTGMPATGKSTVCRLVAEGLSRSTVIEADVVRESIVGGFVQPDLAYRDAFVEQIRLQRRTSRTTTATSWPSQPHYRSS